MLVKRDIPSLSEEKTTQKSFENYVLFDIINFKVRRRDGVVLKQEN